MSHGFGAVAVMLSGRKGVFGPSSGFLIEAGGARLLGVVCGSGVCEWVCMVGDQG